MEKYKSKNTIKFCSIKKMNIPTKSGDIIFPY